MAKLAERCRAQGVGVKKAGHVEANRQFKGLGIFALSIRIQKSWGAEDGRIVGIGCMAASTICVPRFTSPT